LKAAEMAGDMSDGSKRPFNDDIFGSEERANGLSQESMKVRLNRSSVKICFKVEVGR
jgi:hypothetical protein